MSKPQKRDQEEEAILSDREEEDQPRPTQPEAITYGQHPVQMRCPYCLELIRSEIILKPEVITVALGLSVFAIVPNFVMLMLTLLMLQFASSRKHRCPLCERQLGSDGKFLIYFTDEVFSLELFSIGMIFTKKTLTTIALVIFALTVISCRSVLQSQNKLVATTWPEYLSECVPVDPSICLSKYRGKQFLNWQGHLLKVQDNRIHQNKWYLHALSLYMKMQPSLQQGKVDTLLTLNSDSLYYYRDTASQLKHGDKLRFNCSLHERQRGSLKDVMHFHVSEVEVIGHDSQHALFSSQIEEEWIRIHVEDRGGLRSQPEESHQIIPI